MTCAGSLLRGRPRVASSGGANDLLSRTAAGNGADHRRLLRTVFIQPLRREFSDVRQVPRLLGLHAGRACGAGGDIRRRSRPSPSLSHEGWARDVRTYASESRRAWRSRERRAAGATRRSTRSGRPESRAAFVPFAALTRARLTPLFHRSVSSAWCW